MKSVERRSRAAAGSTSVRPRAWSGPCGAGRQDRPAGPGAHPQAEAVRLGPTTVVGLERALAHSWAPGLVAIVHAHPEVALMLGTARCQGRWRVVVGCAEGPGDAARTGRRTQGGHGAAAVDDSTGPRYGRPPPRVKRVRARQPPPPTCHRRRSQPAHRRDTPGPRSDRRVHGEKNVAAGCGQPLAGGAAASLVSRGSPDVSPPDDIAAPLAVATVLAAVAQVRVRQNRTDRGNLCTQAVDDRVDGDGERSRDPARTAGASRHVLGTQSPPPGSGPVTTDTVRTARTPGGTTA